ncbi:hypothetical protein [Sphingomonas parapaucimobilis]|uniref:Uncharacterized protein n=1 Tax=Sphingomonas parapaucimobilis NBRC 15100 TaxID=1219049 RepID=A0A0A1W5J6_9SPHN|nr:hypothetical protein [Sphingomonas parapaucimobilis]GAM00695.1 hypothetical protein SP5_035_00940 [Sphingomonas parapaucimobilis NBRC 15100]
MLLTLLIASTLSAAPARETVEAAPITLNTVAVTTSGGAPSVMPSKATRYCVVAQITGSHLPVKVCRTAEDWIAMDGQIPTGRIARR